MENPTPATKPQSEAIPVAAVAPNVLQGAATRNDSALEPQRLVAVISEYAPASGVLFGAVYLSGFIVVNAHLAEYGIADFEVLRARILAAGIIFAVFTASVVFAVSTRLRPNQAYSRQFREAAFAGLLPYLVFNTLLARHGHYFDEIDVWWFAVWVGFGLTAFFVESQFSQYLAEKHGLDLIVTIVEVFGGYFLAYNALGTSIMGHLVWLFLTGLCTLTLWITPVRFNAALTHKIPAIVLMTVTLAGSFGGFVYGDINFKLGGGELVAASMFPAPEYREVLPDSPTKVWIVEQVSEGYYVVRSRKDRSAWFIPRSGVRAVQMLPEKFGINEVKPASKEEKTLPAAPQNQAPVPQASKPITVPEKKAEPKSAGAASKPRPERP